MNQSDLPVGIVGAGPVGLTAAARLATFGIRTVILEADPALLKQGSKACLIQGDVLEILDKFGCAEPINAEGVTWNVAHTYVRNKEIREAVHPRRIGFGPFVNISQYRIEQVLLARVEAEPLCQVRWSHRVVGLSQHADHVAVEVDTPQGRAEHRFRYLIGCDGVRSEVRRLTGVNWTGYSHRDRFLITDIKAELPFAKDRHFHYDPSFNPGRQLVIHPQPDDVWRIDWQLPPDADIDAERRSGELDRRIRKVIGDVPYEIDWLSTYRFHQRVVDRFRVGRVFLAGDAAHALPPYGSRGMNSGIQDADNLAWKLARVLHGQAGEELLDTYHTERYAAARENLAVTEATIRFMVPPSLPRRIARAILLRLSRPFKSARRHVNSGKMAEPYVYTDSPIVDFANRHPLLGGFAPDGWVDLDGRRERIRRLFGQEFVGLYFGRDAVAAQRFVDQVPPVHPAARLVLVLSPEAAAGVTPRDGVVVVTDRGDRLRADYHAEQATWLLVRPDGHVAAAGSAGDAGFGAAGAGLGAALRRCAGTGAGAGAGPRPATAPHPAPEPARISA
jgi:3-(3-hydroxy-phenyl)propionate hydroxylase